MQHDERAARFVAAVEASKHTLYRVAWLMLARHAEAEDAVSQAVETAWRRLDRLRDPQALPAYLVRCTVNACHAALRRRKRETPMDSASLPQQPRDDGTPVWMYLSHLPPKYRLPLMLRYAEDMPVADIAAALRLPRGTVSSRLHRGLAMLKKDCEQEEQRHG